jgi:phosphocarrier protein HPr
MLQETVNVSRNLDQNQIKELNQEANKYQSNIKLEYGSHVIDAKSILGLFTMILSEGKKVTATVTGPDEQLALEAIKRILK